MFSVFPNLFRNYFRKKILDKIFGVVNLVTYLCFTIAMKRLLKTVKNMDTLTTTRQTICFAYFGDGKFLGWYADSHGSIRPDSPKLYGDKESQKEVITLNFRSKLQKIKQQSELATADSRFSLLDASLNNDKIELSQYSSVELRAYACPFYDGPNPDFDKTAYESLLAERKDLMTKEGIFDIPAPSKERNEAITEFETRYPHPKCNNWIDADYAAVKFWASHEPQGECLFVITA